MRRNLPCLVVLGLYLLCILAANPKGEFPLNDDWSYARSAFALGSGHGLKVDPWAAPSLVGQTLYGALMARIFSPQFLVLRITTLLLSCCTIVLLWGILLRIGFRRDLACITLLAWAFNPLQFSLSFTYMTEIPFIFFIALALYLHILYLDAGRAWILVLSAAALGYAFLIRQTALFFIFAFICSLLFDTRVNLRNHVRRIIPAVFAAGIFVAGYYLWTLSSGGATVALRRKFELLSHLQARQIVGNSYGMLFYLSFMLMPVWVSLISAACRMARGFHRVIRIGFPAVCCAVAVSGLWWFHANYVPSEYLPSASYHARMPFLLNVMYDSGLGPITLDPDYFAPPPTPTHPGVWYAVTGTVAVGAVVSGILLIFGLLELRRLPLSERRRPVLVFVALSFLLLAVFEILFSHLQEGGLFDRHILIVCFPLSLLIGILSGRESGDERAGERRLSPLLVPAAVMVAALGAFCVAATHDYMAWNRIRWEMGRGLLQRGVDPLTIVGGFEFNAWNNYDTFVARGMVSQTNHWWYDKRDYVISMIPLEGYEVRRSKAYFSWVHRRPVPLYLNSQSVFQSPD